METYIQSASASEEDGWFNDRLFSTRTVLLNVPLDEKAVRRVSQSLFILSGADAKSPIDLIISSYGGQDASAFALYDLLKFLPTPVRCIATGIVGGVAAVTYCAVPVERRLSLPNTKFLLHQPQSGRVGSTADLEVAAHELMRVRDRQHELLAAATGKTIEQIGTDTQRKKWLDVEEAIEYGLVSRVLNTRADLT
jgi:ATP-dependent Clp protease protease subunit